MYASVPGEGHTNTSFPKRCRREGCVILRMEGNKGVGSRSMDGPVVERAMAQARSWARTARTRSINFTGGSNVEMLRRSDSTRGMASRRSPLCSPRAGLPGRSTWLQRRTPQR